MQKLKDETKRRIDEAALQLFRTFGYQGVSMRRIAENADMTVGNIYRYYKNKDELFSSLIQPSYDEIITLLEMWHFASVENFISDGGKYVGTIIDTFLEIHKRHANELFILVNGCEGSCILSPVTHIRDLLSVRITLLLEHYFIDDKKGIDIEFFSRLISQNILDGNIRILYEFGNDTDRRNHMLEYVGINITAFLNRTKAKEL